MIQKSPEEMMSQLNKAEEILLEAEKEYRGLVNSILDGFNDGWLPKDMMKKMLTTNQKRLDDLEKSMKDIQELKRQVLELE